ncbi:Uncharacterised protein [Bacteroides uniformis]|uniref:Uncharacterized protein n=1 Tax=Bacteroides uniformis TaxID=820 RepID=A0A174NU55_BACUN|nr:Uncharacterised protein [Bacteroides uniformis]
MYIINGSRINIAHTQEINSHFVVIGIYFRILK